MLVPITTFPTIPETLTPCPMAIVLVAVAFEPMLLPRKILDVPVKFVRLECPIETTELQFVIGPTLFPMTTHPELFDELFKEVIPRTMLDEFDDENRSVPSPTATFF